MLLNLYFSGRDLDLMQKIENLPIKDQIEYYKANLFNKVKENTFIRYIKDLKKELDRKKKIEVEKRKKAEEDRNKDEFGFEPGILEKSDRNYIKKTLLWIVFNSDFKSADKVKALIEYNKMNTEDSNNPFASDLSIQSKIDMLKKLLSVDDIISVINLLSPKDIEYIKTNLK